MTQAAWILEDKDPSDVKDYAIDWADVLAAEDETGIASSVWSSSTPAGLLTGDGSPSGGAPPSSVNGTFAIVWVAGGTAGTVYELTNTIITSGPTPRTHERSIVIPCKQR